MHNSMQTYHVYSIEILVRGDDDHRFLNNLMTTNFKNKISVQFLWPRESAPKILNCST